MSRPGLVQTGPMLPVIENAISGAFEVCRMWEADDGDEHLAAVTDTVKAIVTAGHVRVDAVMMNRFPNLKIVANFGVGYDTVDAVYAGKKGIVVTNTPDVLSDEVADTTVGLILMTVRELGAAERHLRAGKWPDGNYPLTVTTLRTRSVGILGLGRIGKAVARRLEGFDVPIAYFGRRRRLDVPYQHYDSLVDLARDVDTLVSILPGTPETHHIINADILSALGPDGIVINIGRGAAIDETALTAALKNGTIRSAGLDVFEHEPTVPAELTTMEHITLLPHVGSASIHTRNAMGQLVADNLLAYANGTPPPTPVVETPFKGW